MLISVRHRFVEHIPDQLDEGVLYVSIPFGTVVHLCACGCGEEVVTPLGPAEWQVTYDGRTVSLAPSIGNWGFPCRSHYWIDNGRVRWARGFSTEEVELVRRKARTRRHAYYDDRVEEQAGGEGTGGKAGFATDDRSRWRVAWARLRSLRGWLGKR